MPNSPVLTLQGIHKAYRGKSVLQDCSFELEAGEALCIEGANGSGKSTLLALVMGYERADSGRIIAPALGHGLFGYINKPVFFAHLSGRQNIELFMDMRKQRYDRAECEVMLSALNLSERRKRASTYSTGMLKKYGIVRSLLCKPDILVLDEPFSGVDQASIKQLHTFLLSAIRDSNMALLFTNHEAKALEGFPHRTLVLANGQLKPIEATNRQYGTAQFEMETLGACNEAARKVETCIGHAPQLLDSGKGLRFSCLLHEYHTVLGVLQNNYPIVTGWQREGGETL